MEQTADEIKRLQGCINDLLSVLALPAIWSGRESSHIVSTLLDVLLGMLRLDFAYARLNDSVDGSPMEVTRLARRRPAAEQSQEVGRALNHWLAGHLPTSPCLVPNPVGEGAVSIAPLRLGFQDDVGVLVAGSQRPDFPTKIEMLLLQVAANQAAIGLQEARLLSEQKRAAEEIRFQAGLLDAVDQAVIAADVDGVITYWNRFAERLYGWAAPEVIGRHMMHVTSVEGVPYAAAEMLSRWQHGESWTGEYLVQHRNGTIFPALVTDSPIYDSQRVLTGVVRVSIDITERKRAEEELERRVVERTRQLTAVNDKLRKEIIERQRSEQRLATQYAITRVLAQSDSLADATPHILQVIGESMAWEWGARWNIDREAGVLRCESIWHAPDLQAAELDAISRQTAGLPGQSLKGRVWQSAEPAWIAEVTHDLNYMRAPIAAKLGLRGAIAFPLLLRGETVGIMEFFSRTVRQPEQEQLAMLSAIGSQIGQFFERKRVEEEQRKLASLVENSTDFIGIASPEGQNLFVNPTGQKMVGLDGDEHVRATSMLDYVVEQDRERFQQQVLPAVLRDGRWEGELQIRHFRTGAAIPMQHHIFFIKESGSDRRLALASISRDITRRKQREQALARSAAQLKGLAEAVLVVNSSTSVSEILKIVTENARDIIGAHMAVIGTGVDHDWAHAIQAVSLSDKYAAYQDVHEKLDGSGLYALVCELNRPMRMTQTELEVHPAWRGASKDAAPHPPLHSCLAVPLVGSDGQNIGRLQLSDKYEGEFTSEDEAVTVQLAQMASVAIEKARLHESLTKSEAYLRDSEHRLRELAEAIPQHVWGYLPDNSLNYCNQRWRDYYSLTLQEAQREGWTNRLHPDDVEPALQCWREAMLHRKPYEAEVRLRGVDGRYRRFLSRGVPLYDERGQLVQWFGTNTDIEDRKQAEEALLEAQAELSHLTRVMTLGELTASIAHEVNQPLAAVVTNGNACLRWLAREVPDLEEARAAVERIIRDGHRASDVIRRIRTLAKRTDPQKTWLDLNDVIREVVALMHSEVHKHSVSLLMDLFATLPPVLGDRIQVQQVLLNLMMNGIEAMHPITDRPRQLLIRSQRHESDAVLVAVQDAGIGLDPARLARLFDAFFTTKPEGMGLGLSISRRIIEAHGGRLWVTTNDDYGVTLQFTLPMMETSVS